MIVFTIVVKNESWKVPLATVEEGIELGRDRLAVIVACIQKHRQNTLAEPGCGCC